MLDFVQSKFFSLYEIKLLAHNDSFNPTPSEASKKTKKHDITQKDS